MANPDAIWFTQTLCERVCNLVVGRITEWTAEQLERDVAGVLALAHGETDTALRAMVADPATPAQARMIAMATLDAPSYGARLHAIVEECTREFLGTMAMERRGQAARRAGVLRAYYVTGPDDRPDGDRLVFSDGTALGLTPALYDRFTRQDGRLGDLARERWVERVYGPDDEEELEAAVEARFGPILAQTEDRPATLVYVRDERRWKARRAHWFALLGYPAPEEGSGATPFPHVLSN